MYMKNKQFILLFVFQITIVSLAVAQTPQYYYGFPAGKPYTGASFRQYPNWGDTSIAGARLQSVYESVKAFSSVPKGQIESVYLKVFGVSQNTTTTYYDLSISLGYTDKLGFRKVGSPTTVDTFFKELIPVFTAAVYTMDLTKLQYQWLKFPVKSGNFYFDKSRNLVLEVAAGHKPPLNGALFMISQRDTVSNTDWFRFKSGPTDTPYLSNSNGTLAPLDFGFDIKATGVAALGNISSSGLFPNPSSDGRVNLSLDGHQAFQYVVVTVSSSIGQQVYSNQYDRVGQSFFEEINLQGNPPGIYILEAVAGGERVVQRVVLQ